jgi:hypothetical protein
MKIRVLMAVIALAAAASTPALACSIGRIRPAELQREQWRDLREANLIFVARVVSYGWSEDTDDNVTFYEPLQLVSREGVLPENFSIATLTCLPVPALGEVHVFLMRTADAPRTPGEVGTLLGYYDVSGVLHPSLRRRVEPALQRANIE